MKCMTKMAVVIAVLAGLFVSSAHAVPNLINYQGRLTDNAGNPVNGTEQIVFSIYSTATGGTALWSETQSVTATNGIYNVMLGSVASLPADLFDQDSRYLGVKVGTDSECTPRQQITSVAFALKSEDADTIDGVDSTTFLQNGGKVYVSGRKNVWHCYGNVSLAPTWTDFYVVPTGSVLVVTDVNATGTATFEFERGGGNLSIAVSIPNVPIGLHSGLKFEPGTTLRVRRTTASDGYLTLFGYQFPSD